MENIRNKYAMDARKKVGTQLINEFGFLKKTPLRYYKQSSIICMYFLMEKPSFTTYAFCGIVPLYLPGAIDILNGSRLSTAYRGQGYKDLDETSDMLTAESWAESTIQLLRIDLLPFYEQLTNPLSLLSYLTNVCNNDKRFFISPFQKTILKAYTLAYLGDNDAAVACMFDYKRREYQASQNFNKIFEEIYSLRNADSDEYFRKVIMENNKKMGFTLAL